MLFKYIYLTGAFFRNKQIIPCLRELMRTDMDSRSDLLALQNKRLADIVAHAAANSPYYRRLFDESAIDPLKVNSIKDLENLPLTKKTDLLDHNEQIQNTIPNQKEYLSETSGSTGFPLIFRRNQLWDAMHNASVMRGYEWHGVKPWDRNGYLWGYNISGFAAVKTKILDFLQNRFRLFSYSEDEIAKFCKKLERAKYVGGYSSMIYEVAKHASSKSNLGPFNNMTMVKGTSESVEQAFGMRMISEYGAAEAGIMAFECPEGSMHMNMETCVIELIDDEIVVTNLLSHSFPIIRYALGDYIEIDETSQCRCGRHSPIIKSITGRVGANIQGHQNRYPSLVLYYIFKNLAMNHSLELNYQVVQNKKGHLEFRLERTITDNERNSFIKEFEKYFSSDVDFTISENERLVSKKGKTKDFVSLI